MVKTLGYNNYMGSDLDIFVDPFFIGFERLNRVVDSFHKAYDQQDKYPVYNVIRKDEDNYIVQVAVTGFSKDDIEITVNDQDLIIKGSAEKDENTEFIHKGIATRAFTRTFALGDYMEVTGAKLENGLLSVTVERIIPEDKKPKTIKIK
jgi:molecular chaperone IbpA